MRIILISLFVLFSLSTQGMSTEWVDQSDHEIIFIEMLDGTKLEVLDWGGGKEEALVFLPGLALNAHTYDEFATHFTDSFRVISVTRIGHGESELPKNGDFSTQRLATDIITVLDSLDIQNAIFSGHSFAGSELTYLGRHFPSRVKGLIYVDAVQDFEHFPDVAENCPDVVQASMDIFKFKESFYNTQRVLDEQGKQLPFADLVALGKLDEQAEVRDYTDIEAHAIAINYLPEQSVELLLGVENPGGQACFEAVNKMNYLGIAKFIAEKPNADVAAINNSQHMIHMVTPEKLAEIMKGWISRILEIKTK